MKNKILLWLSALALLAFTGCETDGISAREQHNNFASMVNGIYRDPASTAGSNSPVKFPLCLAVAQIGELAPDTNFTYELSREPVLVNRIVSLPLPGEIETSYGYGQQSDRPDAAEKFAREIQSLRNLARDQGAQYLLVVGGSIDSYESHNPLTVLDFTIVGGAVLPSAQIKSDGKGAGALLDVQTGRIVFLVNTQLQDSGMSPTFYADERRVTVNNDLRRKLLKDLADRFLARLSDEPTDRVSNR